MTIDSSPPTFNTLQGRPVRWTAWRRSRSSDDVSIVTAAEQFLSKKTDQIQNVALQTLEGHLRGIVGAMTVEEFYKDRDQFCPTRAGSFGAGL